MKKLGGLLIFAFLLSGCGTTTTSTTAATTASGTWSADLVGGSAGAGAISFVTQFTINGDGSLNISSLTFLTTLTSGSCFPNGGSATGTLMATTNTNNVVSGPFTFVVQSNPAGTTLKMTGTENGTSITGTWSMTGTCAGSGTFTMTETTK